MVSAQIFGPWLDGSSAELRRLLGGLEGVSEETLRRIDRVSRPSGDGPIARFPQDVMLYDRLVMLAFAEHLASGARSGGLRQSPSEKPRAKRKAS